MSKCPDCSSPPLRTWWTVNITQQRTLLVAWCALRGAAYPAMWLLVCPLWGQKQMSPVIRLDVHSACSEDYEGFGHVGCEFSTCHGRIFVCASLQCLLKRLCWPDLVSECFISALDSDFWVQWWQCLGAARTAQHGLEEGGEKRWPSCRCVCLKTCVLRIWAVEKLSLTSLQHWICTPINICHIEKEHPCYPVKLNKNNNSNKPS